MQAGPHRHHKHVVFTSLPVHPVGWQSGIEVGDEGRVVIGRKASIDKNKRLFHLRELNGFGGEKGRCGCTGAHDTPKWQIQIVPQAWLVELGVGIIGEWPGGVCRGVFEYHHQQGFQAIGAQRGVFTEAFFHQTFKFIVNVAMKAKAFPPTRTLKHFLARRAIQVTQLIYFHA
ncbi:hypothetical protein D3C78_1431380 [compost metagenome]